MDDRLRSVFAQALNLGEHETAKLSEQDSIHTVGNWDSLGHVRLILSLETEYGIPIQDEDAVELVDVQRIGAFLRAKGA